MSAPTIDFLTFREEARDEFWSLRQLQPDHPVGTADLFVPPCHEYLDMLVAGQELWHEARELAFKQIPKNIRGETRQALRKSQDAMLEAAAKHPEIRRLYEINLMCELLDCLVDELANEGRPLPPPDLSLNPHRSR